MMQSVVQRYDKLLEMYMTSGELIRALAKTDHLIHSNDTLQTIGKASEQLKQANKALENELVAMLKQNQKVG
jgi:hypothetical protein